MVATSVSPLAAIASGTSALAIDRGRTRVARANPARAVRMDVAPVWISEIAAIDPGNDGPGAAHATDACGNSRARGGWSALGLSATGIAQRMRIRQICSSNHIDKKFFDMRSLNLDQLRTLQEVVDQGSFSGAARQLNLTQPAVSLQ